MSVKKVYVKSIRKKRHTVKKISVQDGEGQVEEWVKLRKWEGGEIYKRKNKKDRENPSCHYQ